MIIMNKTNKKVFVGKRKDNASKAWQLPQGGVEDHEDFIDALFREMEEEIGTKNAEVIAESNELMRYDLPAHLQNKLWEGKYIGQEQKWFLLKFLGEESEINITTEHQEFLEYKWVDIEEIPDLIVEFKREVYSNLVRIFKPIIEVS